MTREEKCGRCRSDFLSCPIHSLLTAPGKLLSTLMHFESNSPTALLWVTIAFSFPLHKSVWFWLSTWLRHLSQHLKLSTADLNLSSFRLVTISIALREEIGPCEHCEVHFTSHIFTLGKCWPWSWVFVLCGPTQLGQMSTNEPNCSFGLSGQDAEQIFLYPHPWTCV